MMNQKTQFQKNVARTLKLWKLDAYLSSKGHYRLAEVVWQIECFFGL